MTRTTKSDTYRRKGYMVTHHIQRTTNAHCHFFVVHDLGALCLPKARHLIRMYVPKRSADGKFRKMLSVSSGVSGTRSIWYQIEIQYQRKTND